MDGLLSRFSVSQGRSVRSEDAALNHALRRTADSGSTRRARRPGALTLGVADRIAADEIGNVAGVARGIALARPIVAGCAFVGLGVAVRLAGHADRVVVAKGQSGE